MVSRAELEARVVAAATAVRERAYAPYSGFRVGAALGDASGGVAVGCNVENASYGSTLCAERGAVMAAVSGGLGDPVVLAIVTDAEAPTPPCGACRQVLVELAPHVEIISVAGAARRRWQLTELLPNAFVPSSLHRPT